METTTEATKAFRWDMVLGAKRGRLSQDAYRTYYLDLMRARYRQHRKA